MPFVYLENMCFIAYRYTKRGPVMNTCMGKIMLIMRFIIIFIIIIFCILNRSTRPSSWAAWSHVPWVPRRLAREYSTALKNLRRTDPDSSNFSSIWARLWQHVAGIVATSTARTCVQEKQSLIAATSTTCELDYGNMLQHQQQELVCKKIRPR